VAYLGGRLSGVGRAARRAFDRVDAGKGRIAVPTLCLFEIALLEERGRLALGMPFDEWCDLVERAPGLELHPLDRHHVAEARALGPLRDPFDRLIAGTAIALGLPLITPDSRIAASRRLPIVW
jgi:PIN domain nuclease of toxin-antitoxin system